MVERAPRTRTIARPGAAADPTPSHSAERRDRHADGIEQPSSSLCRQEPLIGDAHVRGLRCSEDDRADAERVATLSRSPTMTVSRRAGSMCCAPPRGDRPAQSSASTCGTNVAEVVVGQIVERELRRGAGDLLGGFEVARVAARQRRAPERQLVGGDRTRAADRRRSRRSTSRIASAVARAARSPAARTDRAAAEIERRARAVGEALVLAQVQVDAADELAAEHHVGDDQRVVVRRVARHATVADPQLRLRRAAGGTTPAAWRRRGGRRRRRSAIVCRSARPLQPRTPSLRQRRQLVVTRVADGNQVAADGTKRARWNARTSRTSAPRSDASLPIGRWPYGWLP